MEIVQTFISSAKMPDIFKIAAHAWGIEVLCLCLILIFFSIVVLSLGFIGSVNILLLEQVKKKLIWSLTSLLLVGLLALKAFWWWQVFSSYPNALSGVSMYLFLLAVLFFSMCSLLVVTLDLSSFKTKFHFLLMVLYGGFSFFLFWKYVGEVVVSELVFVLAETIFLISLGYIAIFIQEAQIRFANNV